ncbi:segregation and condensation protein A [Spiroplasma endosymbiont of Amphibalanus improvisus]|uniref:segregation and condensation protein A n=1 Tax=Spiroplasma endosymbiont of Amphibalanus improvisus TaxID=3066327 RepID=UPI00313E3CB5
MNINENGLKIDRYIFSSEKFEGPLDLLLLMIKNKEMDITEINLIDLTNQYLEFIKEFKKKHIDLATEYLTTAVYFLEIRVKLLLPVSQDEIEVQSEEEIKNDLILRLSEYKKIKDAAIKFKDIYKDNKTFLSKDLSVLKTPKSNNNLLPLSKKDNIDELAKVFMRMMERANYQKPLESNIVRPNVTAEQMSEKIFNILSNDVNKLWLLEDILSTFELNHKVLAASFVGILDLCRHEKLLISQNQQLGKIYLKSNVLN